MASTCNISPINTRTLIVSSSHQVQNSTILLPKPSLIPWLQLFPSFRFNSLSYLPTRPQPSKSPIRAALDGNYSSEGISSSDEQRETIKVPPGCDFNHWLILMHFPKDPAPTREQMIDTYLDTLATVLGSMEEAKKNMYAFSTTTYTGFQCTVSEEISEKFKVLDGVLWVLPDAYLNVKNKDYGGDKYVNGEIIPSTYQPKPRGHSKYENRRYERRKTGPPLSGRPKQEATQSESASRYVNGEIIPSTYQPKQEATQSKSAST